MGVALSPRDPTTKCLALRHEEIACDSNKTSHTSLDVVFEGYNFAMYEAIQKSSWIPNAVIAHLSFLQSEI